MAPVGLGEATAPGLQFKPLIGSTAQLKLRANEHLALRYFSPSLN